MLCSLVHRMMEAVYSSEMLILVHMMTDADTGDQSSLSLLCMRLGGSLNHPTQVMQRKINKVHNGGNPNQQIIAS
jgi:hypothetical protein